ncbi:MAG: Zn-ribbon domain-containing OB-fold protein [Candidatus Bathyarchaeia archaeon]
MVEPRSFTIDQFYRFIGEKRLMAAKCKSCGLLLVPPRPMCSKCLSTDLEWVELKPRGRILTYTVIYVPPKQFESIAPYAFGIVELEDGPRLAGMIRDVNFDDLKVGMEVELDFEEASTDWPQWPRYLFRPIKPS